MTEAATANQAMQGAGYYNRNSNLQAAGIELALPLLEAAARAIPADGAAPLVITAYSVVWLLVFGYLWSIWRRIARTEHDLAEVTRRIAGAQRR